MPPSLVTSADLQRTDDRIHAGERLDAADGRTILECHNLAALGLWGREARARLHPGQEIGYSVGGAAAFASQGEPGHGADGVCRTATLLQEMDGFDLRLYAGNPAPSLPEWEDVLRRLAGASRTESITRSMSLATAAELARTEAIDLPEVFSRLRGAGLQLVRGETVGTAAQLPPPAWLSSHEASFSAGLLSTAGLPGGLLSPADLISFVMQLRNMQDRTGCFIAFCAGGSGVRGPGDPTAPGEGSATSFTFLRTLAFCRCMLDNIPVMEVGWEIPGTKIAGIALTFGADDLGASGLSVVGAPGRPAPLLPVEEIERLIRDAGYVPQPRNGHYRLAANDSGDRRLPTIHSSRN